MVEQEDSEATADAATGELPEVEGALPPIDFSIFVLSLNTSALQHLAADPDTDGALHENLPMARQTIDILTLLEEKTRGNLTGAEERLVSQVLFDLRMRFSSAVKKTAG